MTSVICTCHFDSGIALSTQNLISTNGLSAFQLFLSKVKRFPIGKPGVPIGSALQTYVGLAGNVCSGYNLAGKFAYRRTDSWEIYFVCNNSLHIDFLNQIWLENTLK